MSQPGQAELVSRYDTIGRFIYAFHRLANPKRLRELAGEGAELSRRFEEALQDVATAAPGPIDEAPLHAILADLHDFVARDGLSRDEKKPR